MLGRRKKRGHGSGTAPMDAYLGLRGMVLGPDSRMTPPAPEHPDVSGAMVDMPSQGGYATVVALTDDTTSMYTSTGGGTIGAGEYPEVAAATHDLLAAVQAHLSAFTLPDAGELPPPGSVRFHVLMPAGSRYGDVPDACFWGKAPSELLPVIMATQRVISAIRERTPE